MRQKFVIWIMIIFICVIGVRAGCFGNLSSCDELTNLTNYWGYAPYFCEIYWNEVITDCVWNETVCEGIVNLSNFSCSYLNDEISCNLVNSSCYWNSSLDAGCNYYDPQCDWGYNCINNSCVNYCDDINYFCGEGLHCLENNTCSLPSGCAYHSPDCNDTDTFCYANVCELIEGFYCDNEEWNCNGNSNYTCSDLNYCVGINETGCFYDNPSCEWGYSCIDNECILEGCQEHNPNCGSNYNCVNNECILKSGCNYFNPDCGSDYDCVNNVCVIHFDYCNPICYLSENCVNNVCVLKSNVVSSVFDFFAVWWFMVVLFFVGCLFLFAFAIRLLRGG
jgi:hypothetical protein